MTTRRQQQTVFDLRKAKRGARRIIRGVSRIPGARGVVAAHLISSVAEQVEQKMPEAQGRDLSEQERFITQSIERGLRQSVGSARAIGAVGTATKIAADIADTLTPLPQPVEVLSDIPLSAIRELGDAIVSVNDLAERAFRR